MNKITVPLTVRIFLAISATAFLVVALMAIMVATSMRDGFSRYLLQGEINRFDNLVAALTDLHTDDPAGWQQFSDERGVWKAFVGQNFRPLGSPRNRQPPPPGKRAGDPLQVSGRLFLQDADGAFVVKGADQGSASVSRPIYADDGATLIGTLGLSTPEGAIEGTDAFFIRGQYSSLILAATVAVALSATTALILARGLLAPIKALEVGARTLSSGQYAVRIHNTRRDELGQLVDHYNALAQSLEAADAAERQFISNTSHELQTPLAILLAEIEALQDGVRQADARTLGEMHGAVMRLSQLVNDLKVLSFTREGQIAASFAPHDLALIAQDAADSMLVRAEQANLLLSCRIDHPMPVQCDASRIRQVIDNILENALRYTAAPGEIFVTGQARKGFVTLTIEDTAPAPPEESLPHLFERFYLAEKSRSRHEGGSGLGLAICDAIARAHGGTITASLAPLGGLRLAFALPEKGAMGASMSGHDPTTTPPQGQGPSRPAVCGG